MSLAPGAHPATVADDETICIQQQDCRIKNLLAESARHHAVSHVKLGCGYSKHGMAVGAFSLHAETLAQSFHHDHDAIRFPCSSTQLSSVSVVPM